MMVRITGQLAAVVLLVTACIRASGDSATASDPSSWSIHAGSIRAHVDVLAADSLEGRGSGTRGFELAARYVRSQLMALGATDGTGNGSYFQPVPLVRAHVDTAATRFELESGNRTTRLRYATDYALMDLQRDTMAEVSGRLVFVGYGVSAPELGHDDYAGIDTKGAIVVFLQVEAPPSFPGTVRAHYASFGTKRETAAKHGAIGALYVRSPHDEARMPWPGLLRELAIGWSSLRWVGADGKPGGLDDQIRVLGTLNRSGAEALFAGETHSFSEIVSLTEKGTPPRFALSKSVAIRARATHERLQSPNVIATLEGSDPSLANEYVLYTAHLDHLGIGPAVNGDSIYNGAMDNAVGSAVMLEVARAFNALPQRPKRSMMFAFVTGEEAGLVGSDFLARHPPVPIQRIVADINLDGAATLAPVSDIIAWGADNSTLGSHVQRAAQQHGFSVSPDPIPEEGIFVRSDQYSFVRQGVPSIVASPGFKGLTPGEDIIAMLTGWSRTKYHSPQDDTTQPIHYESTARFAHFAATLGHAIAMDSERPRWSANDFFGRAFGQSSRD